MMSAYPHYTHAGTPMVQAYSPDWYIQQPSPQQSMYAHSQYQQTQQPNLYNGQSPAGIHYSNQASPSPGHMLHSPAPSTAPSVHTHSSPPYSVPSLNYASPPSSAPPIGYGQPPTYDMKMDIHPWGRKKALLIGINYFGQRGQLRGCINDVKNMSTYLVQQFGYRREDMVILTDDQQNTIGHPTKHNILRAMHWLVKDAEPNDSLFFHYSGHGGQTRDPEVEEHEGYDEVIYPVDFRVNGHISDDEMHRIMVRPLKQGVRLTAIFDSCHSGTALDLPYVYSTQGIMKVPGAAVEAGEQLLQCVSNRVSHPDDEESITSSVFGIVKRAAASGDNFRHAKISKSSMADVIMFSSSKDNQKSADISINAKPTGAMSWAFITALTKNPQQSYVQLLNNIRDELGSQYSQRPQLSSSHPLNATDTSRTASKSSGQQ